MPWVEPKDISAILGRLRRVSSLNFSLGHDVLEYNRLLLALNREIDKIEKSEKELPKKIKADIIECFQYLFRKDVTREIWSQQKRREALKDQPDSHLFLDLPTHGSYVNKLKFYRDPEYLQALPRPPKINGSTGQLSSKELSPRLEALRKLFDYMPSLAFASEYGEEFVQLDIRSLFDPDGSSKSMIASVRGRDQIMALLPHLQKEMLGKGEEYMLAVFLASAKNGIVAPFFLKSFSEYGEHQAGNADFEQSVRQTRVLSRTDEVARRQWDFLRSHAQIIWDKRADIAQAEMMAVVGRTEISINWELIAEILEMDHSQMRANLAASVRESLTIDNLSALGFYVQESTFSFITKIRSLCRFQLGVLRPRILCRSGMSQASVNTSFACDNPRIWISITFTADGLAQASDGA